MSKRRSRHDSTNPAPASAGPGTGFRDPEQAARAVCDALLALSSVHGYGSGRDVLGPALRQLAQSAAQSGVDVAGVLADAPPATPPGAGSAPAGSVNERLFDAVAGVAQSLLAVCHSEMDRGMVNEELYRTMLSAELFERASAGPRDPERCLTAAVPRDLVLDLMYGLAWQRQCAEEAFAGHAPAELCADQRDELHRVTGLLRGAGVNADVDLAMGLGIAVWRPSAGTGTALQGLAFTFGRSVVGRDSADFALQFDPGDDAAAGFAARILYRAHLQCPARAAAGDSLEIDGRVLRLQPLSTPQWQRLVGAIGIDAATLDGCLHRIATLDICPQSTGQAWRRKLFPASAAASAAEHPATTTRH
jgi:hypothetical protein